MNIQNKDECKEQGGNRYIPPSFYQPPPFACALPSVEIAFLNLAFPLKYVATLIDALALYIDPRFGHLAPYLFRVHPGLALQGGKYPLINLLELLWSMVCLSNHHSAS